MYQMLGHLIFFFNKVVFCTPLDLRNKILTVK